MRKEAILKWYKSLKTHNLKPDDALLWAEKFVGRFSGNKKAKDPAYKTRSNRIMKHSRGAKYTVKHMGSTCGNNQN